jgi:undecaprenyl pyrophosphate phosphatase UppP
VKKISAFLFSFIIAITVSNAVGLLFFFTIGLPFFSTPANLVSILIIVIGLIIALYSGILTFRKMFKYLKKELQDI